MTPVLLHLDNALSYQPGLAEQVRAANGREIDAQEIGAHFRLWARHKQIDEVRGVLRKLPRGPRGTIVFTGSGDFHHVSALLVERAIEVSDASQVTIVHFDNHPDWVRFDRGLHCGSWVSRAARLRGVSQVITVGVCSRDIHKPESKSADLSLLQDGLVKMCAYTTDSRQKLDDEWPTIEALGERGFADFLVRAIAGRNIYITIDKDVLRQSDAITNWDQGRMSLTFLTKLLERILGATRVIGIDVCGDWSHARFQGSALTKSLKIGESLLDQPWRGRDPFTVGRVNESANQRLLRQFQTAGA